MDQSRILSRLAVQGITEDSGGPTKAHYLVRLDENGFISSGLLPDTIDVGSINGDLVVEGNLTVNGTTTTLNTEELVIEDKQIILSKNAPAGANAGILIDRGFSEGGYASLLWDEFDQRWKAGFQDTEKTIAYLDELNAHITNFGTHVTNFNNHVGNFNLHLTAGQNTFLDAITVSSTEVNYLSGVTSAIQTQINYANTNISNLFLEMVNLQNNYDAVSDGLIAHKADQTVHITPDQNILLDGIAVSAAEINRLSGVTSNIQTSLVGLSNSIAAANTNLSTHAADASLHITPAQNTLLDSLTVSAAEINKLSGITFNVANEITTIYDNIGELNNVAEAHYTNTANPHSVTKAQVGLGNVSNDAQVRVATTDTITAVHIFNPTVAGAPFTLGANANGQLVTGLNASQVCGKVPGNATGNIAVVGTTVGTVPVLNSSAQFCVNHLPAATTGTAGVMYIANADSVACNCAGANAVIACDLPIQTCSGLNTYFAAGDKSGNARGCLSIDIQPSRATAAQVASNSKSIAIGNCMTISGAAALGIGSSVASAGTCTVAIGVATCSTTCAGTAIGQLTCNLAAHSVAIGSIVTLSGGATSATAIGSSVNIGTGSSSSTAIGTSINIGTNAVAGVAIGCNAQVISNVNYGVAIGNTVSACATQGLALGYGAAVQCAAPSGIAIGTNTNAWGICSTAIGNFAAACNAHSISIGTSAFAGQTGSIAIGCLTRACAIDSISIGNTPGSINSLAAGATLIGGNNNAANGCRATVINGCFNIASSINSVIIGSSNASVGGQYGASVGSRYVTLNGTNSVALGAVCGYAYNSNSIITGCYVSSVGNNSITIGAGIIKGYYECSLVLGGNQIAKQVLTAAALGCGGCTYFCSDNCNYFCINPGYNGYVAFEALVVGREACVGSGAIACSFKMYGYVSCYCDGMNYGSMADITCCMSLHSNGSGIPVCVTIDGNGGLYVTNPTYGYESYWIMDLQTTRLVYPGTVGCCDPGGGGCCYYCCY